MSVPQQEQAKQQQNLSPPSPALATTKPSSFSLKKKKKNKPDTSKAIKSAPKAIISSAKEIKSIVDITTSMCTNIFSYFDYQLFIAINLREFVNKIWTRKDQKELYAKNLTNMIENYNQRTYWIASYILQANSEELRLEIYKKFIDIAITSRLQHNFYLFFNIISALEIQPIHRLKLNYHSPKFEKMKYITQISSNYKHYRHIFNSSIGKAQIPHLAITTKDCFQLEELQTFDELTGNINFTKFIKQYYILREFQQCQQIRPNKVILDQKAKIFLTNLSQQYQTDIDQLWQLSYIIKPRGSTKKVRLKKKKKKKKKREKKAGKKKKKKLIY